MKLSTVKWICRVSVVAAVLCFAVSPAKSQVDSLSWVALFRSLDSTRTATFSLPEDDSGRLPGYHFISRWSYNLDTANKYCNLLLNLAIKLDNQYYMAHGYGYMARYYQWINDLDNARDANMEAIYLWEKLEEKFHLARINMQLASVLTTQGLYDQASRYYHNSLDVFQQLGDSVHISQVLQNLGNINILVRFYDSASDYYTQALTIDAPTHNVYGLIADHLGLARISINKFNVSNIFVLTSTKFICNITTST